jgi:poly(3-hydroxybutyrate) depolymerase
MWLFIETVCDCLAYSIFFPKVFFHVDCGYRSVHAQSNMKKPHKKPKKEGMIKMNYKKFVSGGLIIVSFLVIFISERTHAKSLRLGSYGVNLSQTSVSGLSSGAFMTVQFHIAFSDLMVGAGVIAGGPYYCAGCNEPVPFVTTALTTCMSPMGGMGPDSKMLFSKAKEFERKRWIDKLNNLKDDRVYIFTGVNDQTVRQEVVKQTEQFYRLTGIPVNNIKYVKNVYAGHSIITNNDDDVPCSETKAPYINDCDFFQSQDILRHIYGKLNPPAKQLSNGIIKFDQKSFFDSDDDFDRSSMSRYGYVYVPKSCEAKTCKVHIVFHGCQQGYTKIGDDYYKTTGYNELADTNDIIVLYPQAEASMPINPKGCWDWWGYSSEDSENPDFYKKTAVQISVVKKMLERLTQPRQQASSQRGISSEKGL